MDDLNEVRLIGRITSDLSVKMSKAGKPYLSFTIETKNGGYKKFNSVMAFGDLASKLAAESHKDGRVSLWASVGMSKNANNQWQTGLILYKFEILPDEEVVQDVKVQPKPSNVPQVSDDIPF